MSNQFAIPLDRAMPEGWELVVRTAIVRLGPGLELYYPTNHGCLGVTAVQGFGSSADRDYGLRVTTDFDGAREICLSATANVDAQLAGKGIFAGASGGGMYTNFYLYSAKSLSYSTSTGATVTKAAWTNLPATSALFNSDSDNLWLTFLSMRQSYAA